jgi:hypothetical protein
MRLGHQNIQRLEAGSGSQQPPFGDLGRRHPLVNALLDPAGDGAITQRPSRSWISPIFKAASSLRHVLDLADGALARAASIQPLATSFRTVERRTLTVDGGRPGRAPMFPRRC